MVLPGDRYAAWECEWRRDEIIEARPRTNMSLERMIWRGLDRSFRRKTDASMCVTVASKQARGKSCSPPASHRRGTGFGSRSAATKARDELFAAQRLGWCMAGSSRLCIPEIRDALLNTRPKMSQQSIDALRQLILCYRR